MKIRRLGTNLNRAVKVAWLTGSHGEGYITRPENQPVQGKYRLQVTLLARRHSGLKLLRMFRNIRPCRTPVWCMLFLKQKQSPHSSFKIPITFLKTFVTGVCTALLAVCVAIPGWQFLTQPSPAEQQLRAVADTLTGCAFTERTR